MTTGRPGRDFTLESTEETEMNPRQNAMRGSLSPEHGANPASRRSSVRSHAPRRIVGWGAGLFAAAMLVSGAAFGRDSIVISNDNNALGVKGQTFEILKKEIEKRLGKKAPVELSHGGTLFDQKTQIQGLQLGSVDIIAPTSGIYAPVAPAVNALTLPFLLSTPAEIDKALKDPAVRAAFVPKLQAKNIEPVAIWINGPRDFGYRGSKPVLVPADLKGMKIRVQSVPADIETMKRFGANVVGMSWSEVPTALQQGVIDAVEPTPNALVGAGLHETIDQVTRVEYQFSFYIVGANKKWWDGLSADTRKGVQEALDVATKWNWENTGKENDAAYAKVAALGKKINTLTPAQRKEWQVAVGPVWETFGTKTVGADVMKRLKEIGQVEQ